MTVHISTCASSGHSLKPGLGGNPSFFFSFLAFLTQAATTPPMNDGMAKLQKAMPSLLWQCRTGDQMVPHCV